MRLHNGMQSIRQVTVQTKESIVSPFFSSERKFIFMAMKEPSKEELTEAIIFITDRWQAFGDELIDVIKHTPLEDRHIFQPLTNKYNEACRTLASMIEKWPDAPSHEKPDI